MQKKTSLDSSGGRWETARSSYPINMKASIESGQPLTFHSVYKSDNGIARVSYVTEKGAIELRYDESRPVSTLNYRYHGNYTKASASREVRERFRLDQDMAPIYERMGTDRHLSGAISSLHGMRVTKNDPWETTLCFVISQYNNIKRIKGIVRTMVEQYGEVLETGETLTRLFPSPEAISRASEESLGKCGLGFRAKYVAGVAKACSEGLDLEELHRLDYTEAKSQLMNLEGIGEKVADCILLMGYGKLNAFPVDVWIKRSMQKLYFNNNDVSSRQIREFASRQWGEYAGYAQQYLFHNARIGGMTH